MYNLKERDEFLPETNRPRQGWAVGGPSLSSLASAKARLFRLWLSSHPLTAARHLDEVRER